jgi:hypothetical protein
VSRISKCALALALTFLLADLVNAKGRTVRIMIGPH